MKILRSFEEFVFEVATWLVLYPRTLIRIVARPVTMLEWAEREEAAEEARRYDEHLNPIVLLLLTLAIAAGVAAALHVQNDDAPVSATTGWLRRSPEYAVLFRSILFSLLPLTAAVDLARRRGQRPSRESLRRPFYAECYLVSPFAIAVSAGADIFIRPDVPNAVGVVVIVTGLAWFLTAQMRWFRHALSLSWPGAALATAWATGRAVVYMAAIMVAAALI